MQVRRGWRAARGAALALLALATPACGEQKQAQASLAQVGLPALTGRVVDNASLLRPETEATLTAKFAALEASTTDQFVVATVPSLGRRSIGAFGLALGRGWGVGQKDLDIGVLLIVAPAERTVRIEVGYGLERVLSDDRAASIIREDIIPRFKEGRMEEGVVAGAEAIVAVLQASPARALRGRKS